MNHKIKEMNLKEMNLKEIDKYNLSNILTFLNIEDIFNLNKSNKELYLLTNYYLNKKYKNLIDIVKYQKDKFYVNKKAIDRLLILYKHANCELKIFLRLLKIFNFNTKKIPKDVLELNIFKGCSCCIWCNELHIIQVDNFNSLSKKLEDSEVNLYIKIIHFDWLSRLYENEDELFSSLKLNFFDYHNKIVEGYDLSSLLKLFFFEGRICNITSEGVDLNTNIDTFYPSQYFQKLYENYILKKITLERKRYKRNVADIIIKEKKLKLQDHSEFDFGKFSDKIKITLN